MAQKGYKLDFENPKQNVFVTQLDQREDEEDQVTRFPVVQESGGKLLETGIHTLQRTLLLRKQVEVGKVDEELLEKREEFRKRMEACALRQIDIQKRQEKMKTQVKKFETFIKENEAKRRRAIQKYQQEVKLKEQKDRELEELYQQLDLLKERNDALKRRLEMYEKFKDYLLGVVDILPANYLEVQDSMINGLMMRHRTLADTNTTLLENLIQMDDKHELIKQEYKEMEQDHSKMKVSINSELSTKQKSQETHLSQNNDREQKFLMDKVQMRARREEHGQILMAIENLAEKCRRKNDPDWDSLEIYDKLDIVKRYIVDKNSIQKLAQQEPSASPTLDQKSSHKTLKPALKIRKS